MHDFTLLAKRSSHVLLKLWKNVCYGSECHKTFQKHRNINILYVLRLEINISTVQCSSAWLWKYSIVARFLCNYIVIINRFILLLPNFDLDPPPAIWANNSVCDMIENCFACAPSKFNFLRNGSEIYIQLLFKIVKLSV